MERNHRLTISWLVAALSFPGCTSLERVLRFGQQMEQVREMARIEGRIDTEAPAEGTLVVVLARPGAREGDSLIGVDSYVRVRPGSYAFPVAPGRYRAGAYEDRNQNGLLDPGERTITFTESPLLEVGPGARVRHDLFLARDATTPPELTEPLDILGLVERTPKEQANYSLWAWSVQGEVCRNLADPAFGPEAGPHGLWEMTDALNEGRAGIWFLEPHDPQRVPVLFVHGISGYPQEFTELIEGLDRERFQPWFYFYPSGFPLDGVATHLATLLVRLQVQHDFDSLAIVAHSMGGLVARGAILKYAEETRRDDVRLFVTLSTPWGGDANAEGAREARVELPPVFADLDPASDYLRWLFYRDEGRTKARPLPEGTAFHMLVGYHMEHSGSQANDGRVSVASQARLEAQAQARSVRALDYGHSAILRSPEASERLNQLLAKRFD